MEVADAHTRLLQIVGEIFRHSLGEGGDQNPLTTSGPGAYLAQQIVDLALDRPDFDYRVDQSRGPNDLF
ncbi:hypothetical protein IH922_07430, partial [candidate division KSB1 bacterium]|nr:hypothetical protein [candidate division KSB1 bacterium]